MKRVAINGFGRIGRMVFRLIENDPEIEVVAINDLSDIEEMKYLLTYDSVQGKFDKKIEIENDQLIIDNKKIKILCEKDAIFLPWQELNIDVIIECTGAYTKLEDAKKHIAAGAKHVIISAPGKGDMKTIVYGVNEKILDGTEEIISAASCTTNCLAPVLAVLNNTFGVKIAYMSTIHAYTNDQVNLDVHHKKGHMSRRGRACALNIIPAETGAASAIGKVLPELNGKISGSAFRVPVGDGSMIDLTLMLEKSVTKEEINKAFEDAISDTLNITYDPIVSSDIIGSTNGALIDGLSTEVLTNDDNELIKVVAWYDNEYGYSAQLVRTIKCFINKEV